MITLALDTTGAWCTSTIVDADKVLADTSEKIGRGHAEFLAPAVEKCITQVGLLPPKINRIAVCTGPGSFTGLRVALAFARSFALPSKIPVIGVTALRALAWEADPEKNLKVLSIIDAKRGELCWALYDRWNEIISPRTQSVAEAKTTFSELSIDRIVGDGAVLAGFESSAIDHVSGPIMGWQAQRLEPLNFPPDPFYARGPDAKLPGGISP